jgi:hypothetical protein
VKNCAGSSVYLSLANDLDVPSVPRPGLTETTAWYGLVLAEFVILFSQIIIAEHLVRLANLYNNTISYRLR